MFLSVDMEMIFHTEIIGYIYNLHNKFHMSSSTGSLVITIKLEVLRLYMDAVFYIQQKEVNTPP